MVETLREALIIYAKGFLMGCADAVPGVSGGTIALITGIYGRLIDSITSITPRELLNQALALFDEDESLDILFLMVLGAGILSAILLTLNFVHYMISNQLVATYSFFFGLISASLWTLKDEVDLGDSKKKFSGLTGFLLAFTLSGYATVSVSHGGLILFLSGMIAVTAMVLPGVSGSLLLLILGQYEYITAAVSNFTDSVPELLSGQIGPVISSSKPLLIFSMGGLIGLFTAAKTVEKALEHDRRTTMVFLVSMVLGSLRAPVLRIDQYIISQGLNPVNVAPEIISAVLLGALTVLVLHQVTEDQSS
jgi:putative membrane protein